MNAGEPVDEEERALACRERAIRRCGLTIVDRVLAVEGASLPISSGSSPIRGRARVEPVVALLADFGAKVAGLGALVACLGRLVLSVGGAIAILGGLVSPVCRGDDLKTVVLGRGAVRVVALRPFVHTRHSATADSAAD